jgi:WD40 repeat protein
MAFGLPKVLWLLLSAPLFVLFWTAHSALGADDDSACRVIKFDERLLSAPGSITEGITTVSYTPDGKQLVVGLRQARGVFLDPATMRITKVYPAKGNATNGVAVCPSERYYVCLQNSVELALYDTKTEREIETIKLGDTEKFTCSHICFLDRHHLFVLGRTEKAAVCKVWDVQASKEIASFPNVPLYSTVNVRSGAAGIFTTLTKAGDIQQWTVKKKDDKYSLEEKSLFKGAKGTVCFAFSSDGKKMVTGSSDDKLVHIWDVESVKETAVLKGHTGAIEHVAFTLDGTMPISWSRDGTLRLWDVAKAEEAVTWTRPTTALPIFVPAPDGKTLIETGQSEETFYVWDLDKIRKAKKEK